MGLTSAGWAQTYSHFLRLGDTVALVTSFFIAGRFAGLEVGSPLSGGASVVALSIPYWIVGLMILVLWLTLLEGAGSRKPEYFAQGNTEFSRVFNATLFVFLTVAALSFLIRAEPSRLFLGLALSIGLVLVFTFRAIARRFLWLMRSRGKMKTTVVLVGTTGTNQILRSSAPESLWEGWRLVGTLSFSKKDFQDESFVDKVVNHLRDDEGQVDIVVISDPHLVSPQLRDELSARLELLTKGLALWATPEEIATTRMRLRTEPSVPLIRIRDVQLSVLASSYKRLFDLVTAGTLLVLLLPFFLLVGAAIKADSAGPVFFRQVRVGQFGREFSILKFRTMVQHAEKMRVSLAGSPKDAGNEVLFKMKDDPRVTRIGKLLRASSVDELPQLVNVLLGDMSLVGPRPPLPSEVATYQGQAHRRLAAKPGLTGLWQVSGRSDLSWEDSLKFDLQYVENWSPVADLFILLRTIPAVMRGSGAY